MVVIMDSTPNVKLEFKYCECGCKGSRAGKGELSYWCFWDLRETVSVRRGHGHTAPLIGHFKSHKEAWAAARQDAAIRLQKLIEALTC